jgi:hypothetical protein
MSVLQIVGIRRQLSIEQQKIVVGTLRSMLDSPHFSKSKRYPALLEFAVRAALDENSGELKERTVGVQVFGRPADYDTSIDSVVRIAAGEVRRRMAVYFSEHPEMPVRFDLPAGSYKAEFHFRSQPIDESISQEPRARIATNRGIESPQTGTAEVRTRQVDAPVTIPEVKTTLHRWFTKSRLALAAMLVFTIAGAGLWRQQHERARQEFWWPVLHGNQASMILVGKRVTPPDATLALNDAIVTAQVCSVLREYQRECAVSPAVQASVDDLRGKSLVLIGGFNNPWTNRLLAPLPYQIRFDSSALPLAQRTRLIVDHKATGDVRIGAKLGADDPSVDFSKDYAIIARFRSDITDGMAVVIAGLGLPGTSGAGQFVSSPEKMRELLLQAPKDWKGTNFEAVLQIDVVHGNSNHVEVIASHFW